MLGGFGSVARTPSALPCHGKSCSKYPAHARPRDQQERLRPHPRSKTRSARFGSSLASWVKSPPQARRPYDGVGRAIPRSPAVPAPETSMPSVYIRLPPPLSVPMIASRNSGSSVSRCKLRETCEPAVSAGDRPRRLPLALPEDSDLSSTLGPKNAGFPAYFEVSPPPPLRGVLLGSTAVTHCSLSACADSMLLRPADRVLGVALGVARPLRLSCLVRCPGAASCRLGRVASIPVKQGGQGWLRLKST